MAAPLFPVQVISIYEVGGQQVALPKRMAHATPDMKLAIFRLGEILAGKGGRLVLSDLFRSYDMQLQAHMDHVSKKKKAFSPPPGGSMHEAGRALDLDLDALGMPLRDAWPLAKSCGLVPIIKEPDSKASEAWHFECRGSHQRVYDYYADKLGDNFKEPYAAMTASAIASIGEKVDKFGDNGLGAQIQSALIRLGHKIGNMDGSIGPKSRAALQALGLDGFSEEEQFAQLQMQLEEAFPDEYFDRVPTSPLDL